MLSPPTNAEQILKACEEKYKEAMSEGIKGMSDFRERYVDNAKVGDGELPLSDLLEVAFLH